MVNLVPLTHSFVYNNCKEKHRYWIVPLWSPVTPVLVTPLVIFGCYLHLDCIVLFSCYMSTPRWNWLGLCLVVHFITGFSKFMVAWFVLLIRCYWLLPALRSLCWVDVAWSLGLVWCWYLGLGSYAYWCWYWVRCSHLVLLVLVGYSG